MKKVIIILVASLAVFSCKNDTAIQKDENTKFSIVTTTTMLTDLAEIIGGNAVEVQGLMGSGVDPHYYKATEGDVKKLMETDLILYNGVHLEAKLADVFAQMGKMNKETFAVGDALPKENLIPTPDFGGNYDPHLWFSVENWKQASSLVTDKLIALNPKNKEIYLANNSGYQAQLDQLKVEITNAVAGLPEEKRRLVTAHDAFNYFGKEFGFHVDGLQGLSTTAEAGVKDVQNLADYIVDKQVKSIFVETSVPKRTIEALQAAVKAKGFNVGIGGELFSDALGSPGTEEGTYIGMYKHNIHTIVNALK